MPNEPVGVLIIGAGASGAAFAQEGAMTDRLTALRELRESVATGTATDISFICLTPVPTIMNHSIDHVNPEFDADLRTLLMELSPDALRKGTYIQTRGPRLESRAEIAWMKQVAEIVGMTIASELTVSSEMGLPFAAICTVDNYANGVCDARVSYEFIISMVRENQRKAVDLLDSIIRSVS